MMRLGSQPKGRMMVDFLYEFLRTALAAGIVMGGATMAFAQGADRGRILFGRLNMLAGGLFMFSALSARVVLPVDLDNLSYQTLMFAQGLAVLDIILFLFGGERREGGKRVSIIVGAAYCGLLTVIPMLDYALGLRATVGNVEDGFLRAPFHAGALAAAYAWPIGAATTGLVLARWKLRDVEGSHRESRLMAGALGVLLPLLVAALVGLALEWKAFYRIDQLALQAFLILGHLYVTRNPRAVELLRDEIGEEHVRRLSLSESEMARIDGRLAAIVEEGSLLRDENFGLQGLAEAIGLPAYRLSAYFSRRLSSSFPAWRNARRIDFVKARMAERPDMTILDISLEAGYRSKASFNDQFQRLVGMSPSEYRKRLQAGQ